MVADQRLQPTFTADLAAGADRGGRGGRRRASLHLTRPAECSWHEFTEAIMELAGIDVRSRRSRRRCPPAAPTARSTACSPARAPTRWA